MSLNENDKNDGSLRNCVPPPKGGLLPRSGGEQTPDTLGARFDLSEVWSKQTADIIAAAWITHRDQTDPQPIREHYRTAPSELRAVLANIMTGGSK